MKKHIAASAVCALCMAFCAGAAAELPAPPEIPQGDLRAQVIAFEPGKTYKVFDEASLWHMNADGAIPAVSTDNWIQVFGRDGDTILIQYPVDETHMRFGYIQADALPVAGEPGRYVYEGAVPEGIYEVKFSIVRGEEEIEILNPQW